MRYINNRGSATFLIVLLVMVILTVSIGFNWLVREYVRTAHVFKDKAEAMLKTRSAYDTIMYMMLNGTFTPKEIIFPGIEGLSEIKSIPLNGKEVTLWDDLSIKVQDTNGIISITSINTVALKRLLTYFGFDITDSDIAINSLLDWIDQDDLVRINGAEKSYYSSQGLGYEPRNYQIQYKEELKLIRGFGKEVYSKLEPYITVLPASGFNPNTAPDTVLLAYLELSEDTLKILKEYIATKPVTSDTELYSLTGRRIITGEAVYFYPSSFLEITVQAGKPKPYYRINAGIDLRETVYSPYNIIYWKEE